MVVTPAFCAMKMSFNSLFCVPCDKIISVRLGLGDDLDSHLVEFLFNFPA